MNAKTYDNRIRRIAMLRGMRLARRVLIVLLCILALWYTYLRLNTVNPVLLLIFICLGPIFSEQTFDKNKDEEQLLPGLSQKYGYTEGKFKGNLFAFVIAAGLLVVWEYSSLRAPDRFRWLYPFACIMGYVGTYLVRSIILIVRMRRDLLEGKI